MNSDLLDKYCHAEFGHDDWEMKTDKNGNCVITFFKQKRDEEEDA